MRFAGVGKKGAGADDEAKAKPVDVDDEAEADGSCTGVDASVDPEVVASFDDGRPKGAVIPKVSPAPSQSELVSNGV